MGESKSVEKGYFKLNTKTIMTDEERNVVLYDIDTYCVCLYSRLITVTKHRTGFKFKKYTCPQVYFRIR